MNKKVFVTWLWSGIILITLMVIIGGITRLTGSGLSMVSWNLISGAIPPLSEVQWINTFEEYKNFPEYQKLNYNMSLDGFKRIFWWEYIHRLLGRIIGIVFLVPFLWFLVKKRLPREILNWLLLILFFGIAQGAMGWIMVKSGLQDNPHVSHYRLAMHLGLALILIGLILWLILKVQYYSSSTDKALLLKNKVHLPLLGLAAVFVQIVFGAFVAGLKAGYSYNTFPLMKGAFFPSDSLNHSLGFFENGIILQFIHRWFAFIGAGIVILIWYKTKKSLFFRQARFYAHLMFGVFILQIMIGIFTLVLRVPLALGIIHQLLAVILFGLMVTILFHLRYSNHIQSNTIIPRVFIKKEL